MGLVEDIQLQAAKHQLGRRCKLGQFIYEMDPQEQDAITYAIDMVLKDEATAQPARIFTKAWLTKTLNDNGYSIGKTVVSDHLSGECPCE